MNEIDDTLPAGEGEKEDTIESLAPGLDMLIDEHEEEVSENGKTVRRRGIFLLPNLITTGGLFCGFYAIVASMRGDFESAAIAIFSQTISCIPSAVSLAESFKFLPSFSMASAAFFGCIVNEFSEKPAASRYPRCTSASVTVAFRPPRS
jgi:hypothetical protein